MAKKKKSKPALLERLNLRLFHDEKVLYVTKPGRRMDLFFSLIVLALIGACVALYLLGAWGLTVNNPVGGGSSISVASVGVAGIVAVILYRFYVMGHVFVLTNRRVIVLKGRKLASRKFLNLDEIGGAEMNQGFFYRLFGLATIDFFSPSSQPKTRTFLLIISFTSTSFKFIYLAHKDGEAVYDLLAEELEKLPKRQKS